MANILTHELHHESINIFRRCKAWDQHFQDSAKKYGKLNCKENMDSKWYDLIAYDNAPVTTTVLKDMLTWAL